MLRNCSCGNRSLGPGKEPCLCLEDCLPGQPVFAKTFSSWAELSISGSCRASTKDGQTTKSLISIAYRIYKRSGGGLRTCTHSSATAAGGSPVESHSSLSLSVPICKKDSFYSQCLPSLILPTHPPQRHLLLGFPGTAGWTEDRYQVVGVCLSVCLSMKDPKLSPVPLDWN